MRMNSAQTCQPDAIRLPISGRHRRIDMERPRVELPREGNHFGFGDGARGKRKNIAGGEIFEETLWHPVETLKGGE